MEWLRKRKTQSAVDEAMAITQDFMELHDSQRMRTVGTLLLRPTSGAAEPEAYEDLVIQSLSELEIGVRYRTARDNLAVRTPEGKVLLSGLGGAHPVAVDMGSENATREVIDHAQQAGAGRPPADPSVAYRVRFTLTTPSLTTAGKKAGISTKVDQLVLKVHPEWAPIAAARFYMLVQQQFFIGSRFYSTIPGFITQFGLPANPQTEVECIFTHTRQRWSIPIPDDPVLQKNTAGRVAFVTTGANTRTTALFVSLADNSMPGMYLRESLDSQGVAPFAEVVEGAAAVTAAVNAEYTSEPVIPMIVQHGNMYLQRHFPNLTYISACKFEPPTSVDTDAIAMASMQRMAWAKAARSQVGTGIMEQVALAIPRAAPAAVLARNKRQLTQSSNGRMTNTDAVSERDAIEHLHISAPQIVRGELSADPGTTSNEATGTHESAPVATNALHSDRLRTGADVTSCESDTNTSALAGQSANVDEDDLNALDELDELDQLDI